MPGWIERDAANMGPPRISPYWKPKATFDTSTNKQTSKQTNKQTNTHTHTPAHARVRARALERSNAICQLVVEGQGDSVRKKNTKKEDARAQTTDPAACVPSASGQEFRERFLWQIPSR